MFDAKNKDKICVMDWGDWPILPMALHAGIDPYLGAGQAALKEVRMVLRAMFKNTRTLVADLTQAQKGAAGRLAAGLHRCGPSDLGGAQAGHKNIMATVPDPKNGLKQGIIWVEATAILKETDQPELAQKLIKHVVSRDPGTFCRCSTPPATSSPIRRSRASTDEEKSILQVDYMWHAYENSQMHRIAPNIDEMLAIWSEELASAQ